MDKSIYVAAKPATVQDLLRHTAGLTYEFLGNSAAQKAYRASKIGMSLSDASNAEFSKILAAQPLQYEPGTVWEYSRATDVLGVIVEVVSGQTLGNFLQDHIFKPLKMLETGFSVPSDKHHRIAEPFKKDPDGGIQLKLINIQDHPKFESGGGGLASTAHDYARFLQFMLNKGELDGVRLLGSHTVDFMTADHLGEYTHQRTAVRRRCCLLVMVSVWVLRCAKKRASAPYQAPPECITGVALRERRFLSIPSSTCLP